MRKRTLRLFVPALLGGLAGAGVVFFGLVWLGTRGEPLQEPSSTPPTVAETVSPITSPSAFPSYIASPSTSSHAVSSASKEERTIRNDAGGFSFTLPQGYRLADKIIALEKRHLPAAATITITKGSIAEEEAYVRLIETLQQDQTATEAPAFRPGTTLSVLRVTGPNLEASDAQLARSTETLTTASGLKATRYRRVEGLFTYDMTYVHLNSDTLVAVQMSYGSEEPLFDEAAYRATIDSLERLSS